MSQIGWAWASMQANNKIKLYSYLQLVRAWCQFSVILTHFLSIFYDSDNFSHLPNLVWIYSGYWLARGAMSAFFIISGMNSARWFFDRSTKTVKTGRQTIVKFYFDRIFNHAVLYYMVFFMYIGQIKFLVSQRIKDESAESVCHDGLAMNLLFISNLFAPDKMVWIIEQASGMIIS